MALHNRRFELVLRPGPCAEWPKWTVTRPARLLALGGLPDVVRERLRHPLVAADQAASRC